MPLDEPEHTAPRVLESAASCSNPQVEEAVRSALVDGDLVLDACLLEGPLERLDVRDRNPLSAPPISARTRLQLPGALRRPVRPVAAAARACRSRSPRRGRGRTPRRATSTGCRSRSRP